MRKLLLLFVVIVFGLGSASIVAQEEGPPGPPKVLLIYREEVKAGKNADHEAVETAWVNAFRRANWPEHYIGMNSVTGPNEAWYLVGYESFAAMEKLRNDLLKHPTLSKEMARLDELDAQFRANQRVIVTRFRPDLSYDPTVNIPTMRYFTVVTVRVRPGQTDAFEESSKLINAAHREAKMDEHWAVFQVTSGMAGPTYLIFAPYRSMSVLDSEIHSSSEFSAAFAKIKDKVNKIAAEAIVSIDSSIFAFNPKISYVSKEFAAQDSDFWNPRPVVSRRAHTPKTVKKVTKP
jgi:hypothetical protein